MTADTMPPPHDRAEDHLEDRPGDPPGHRPEDHPGDRPEDPLRDRAGDHPEDRPDDPARDPRHAEPDAAAGQGGGNAPPSPAPPRPLPREDVVAAFELMLGRPPESEAVIAAHRALPDRPALGRVLRGSAEFRLSEAEGRADTPDCVPLLAVRLGRDGDAAAALGGGWGAPDDRSRWTVAADSTVALPLPEAARGCELALTMALAPFHRPQRLRLAVDGRALLEATVGGPTVLGCRVPASLTGGPVLPLSLWHPDGVRPCDVSASLDERALGFAVEAVELARAPLPLPAPAPTDEALLRRFGSLGETCEFGFVLSRFDRGGSGLLRFSAMHHDALLRGLREGFPGFPDRARMRVERHGTRTGGVEAMVVEDGWRFITHSGVADAALEGETDAALLDREAPRLRFLRRLFLEELRDGRTVFVHRAAPGRALAEVEALWLALRRLGRCALLWVAEAEPGLPPGSVLELGEGFLKGFLPRLAPADNAEDYDLEGWLTLCRRALRLAAPAMAGDADG